MFTRTHSFSVGRQVCLLIAPLLFTGCSKSVPPDPQAGAKMTAKMQIGQPLSDDECLEFARKFSSAIEQGDAVAANALVDWDAMIAIAAADLGVADRELQGFAKGLKQQTTSSNGLAGQIIGDVQNGSTYNLLRIHHVNSMPRAMFRLMNDSSGMNYHDLLLARRPDGQVRIVDFELAATGELSSQTMRRIMIPLVSQTGLLARLQGKEKELLQNAQKMQLITQSFQSNQFQRVLDLIKELPPSLQQDKLIMLFRVQAATGLDNEAEYNSSIEAFVKQFPDDSSLPLLLIDYYLKKGEYEKSLKQVSLVDKNIGGDPYLNALRAGIQVAAGKLDEARKLGEQVRLDFSDLPSGYWIPVNIALKEMNYMEALEGLKTIKTKFNVMIGDLTVVPDYAGFVKSPQYQEWLEFSKGQ